MIIGLGIDITNIDRVGKLVKRFGDKFLTKVYTDNELTKLTQFNSERQKVAYLAKRFSAKEAFVKALGTGFREKINFKDIEVINSLQGCPSLRITGAAEKKLIGLVPNDYYYVINLSLSDEHPLAAAIVILSCGIIKN